jgi:hypothetical protein
MLAAYFRNLLVLLGLFVEDANDLGLGEFALLHLTSLV